jgi:hypothetical protein
MNQPRFPTRTQFKVNYSLETCMERLRTLGQADQNLLHAQPSTYVQFSPVDDTTCHFFIKHLHPRKYRINRSFGTGHGIVEGELIKITAHETLVSYHHHPDNSALLYFTWPFALLCSCSAIGLWGDLGQGLVLLAGGTLILGLFMAWVVQDNRHAARLAVRMVKEKLG